MQAPNASSTTSPVATGCRSTSCSSGTSPTTTAHTSRAPGSSRRARLEAHQALASGGGKKEPWNGTDFYVSFGEGPYRSWEDARRYGFISGGGGKWYSQTLEKLQPGARVFVHIPQKGYVGIGEVVAPRVPVRDFTVTVDGNEIPILSTTMKAPKMGEFASDPDLTEYLVRIRWTKTAPETKATWETGMFANQNTACALRSSFTRERVLAAFGLDE
jgi:hypothetical protein